MDTRLSLETTILGWLDEAGNTDVTRDNVRAALTAAHIARVTESDWKFMLWGKAQRITTVAGQTVYPLHSEFGRAFYFRNVTDSAPLTERTRRHFNANDSNDANAFTLWGQSPVANYPTAASTLTIVSSNAGDTGSSRGVYVRGETADGVMEETIQANGTTPVVSVNTYLPGGLLQVVKFGTWTGKMTMTSDSGAVTNLVLPSSESARQYQQIQLLWTPNSAKVLEYNFYRKPSPLDDDWKIPDIPFPFSQVLIWDVLVGMAAYDGRLDGERANYWLGEQAKLDLALRQAYEDGQSLGAEPEGILLSTEDME